MKGNTLRSGRWSGYGLVYSFLRMLDDMVPNILHTCYSFLSYFVGDVDKEWIAEIRKALYLSSDGTVDRCCTVSPILHAAMMRWGHQSYLFQMMDEVLFLRWMVWLMGCMVMIVKQGTAERETTWKEVENEYGSVLKMVFMANRYAALKYPGYPNLHGIAILSSFSLSHRSSGWYPYGLLWNERAEAVLICDVYVFWRKSSKRSEELHALDPIYNYAVDNVDRPDCAGGVPCYSFSKEFVKRMSCEGC